jgi:hypothetical protein
MSTHLIRRTREGVVLRYADPTVLRPHHIERKHQPGDVPRCQLIEAEFQLGRLEIICECADFSDIALERIYQALETIRSALESIRPSLGMERD